MKVLLVTAVVALVVLTACGGREVTRTDTDTVTDLSGYWNDTDARIVADSIVDQCLNGRWFDVRETRDSRVSALPVIVVGGVRNQSIEHINVDVFMSEIERSLLNSGRFQIAAGGRERGEVRDERRDQSVFASPETAAEFGREVGADYVMTGTVNSIEDQEDDTRAIFYQVNIELIDVETALKVWMGSTEIKKIIEW
ncbi:MAG: penicillin-binding protein activator LpoB [Candidatus Fermentibacteraceae bacterium]|nr:penicillin-binding protein activator LpoB [Candidatus Fermentibacteraceae bacterium]